MNICCWLGISSSCVPANFTQAIKMGFGGKEMRRDSLFHFSSKITISAFQLEILLYWMKIILSLLEYCSPNGTIFKYYWCQCAGSDYTINNILPHIVLGKALQICDQVFHFLVRKRPIHTASACGFLVTFYAQLCILTAIPATTVHAPTIHVPLK